MKQSASAPELIRIRPRPFTSYISRGRSVLATTPDGRVDGDSDHGFFVHETRLVSRWRYAIDGETPRASAFSSVRQHHWLGYFAIAAPRVPRPPQDEGSGQVPPESQITLELCVTRVVDGGLHEDIDLTNFAGAPSTFVFAIACDADFAGVAEPRERQQQGSLTTQWDRAAQRLTLEYTATSDRAALRRIACIDIAGDGAASFNEGRLLFEIALEPRQRWHACVRVSAVIDDQACRLDAPRACYGAGIDPSVVPVERETTRFEDAQWSTMSASVVATLEQARADLAALRLPDLDSRNGWTVAAGLPQYLALFGRDTLTAGWQSGIVGAGMMAGALDALAKRQGVRDDDWTEEQRGRMLHEEHTGPLSKLGINPRARSYGSITTSGLYPFMVAELWHWTGDKALVRQYVEPALRALQWLDRHGDLDGDGFYEYRSRSPMGPRNQAWKDSPDAIVYEDGALVEPPIATCEEQAFVYAAKLHFSETLWWLGEHDLARRIYREAAELRKRFHDAFWMPDEGFYALALDANKRQVRSIASNAGHCVATAIADADAVPRIVDRLFAPDLFSGWGIRTLSSDHPRYNPYSYHLGSIWPVEQGTFAIGFMRYGLFGRVEQIARAQFEAASLFEFHRLPELFGGHPRDARHPFPAIYPNASSPQAWSSSSVFCLLQALLGLYPYAPLRMLIVDPHLPVWLPEITLRDLRVGRARVTIHFRRERGGRTSYRVTDLEGTLHVVRQATPWSLTTTPAERLRDALASLIPHH